MSWNDKCICGESYRDCCCPSITTAPVLKKLMETNKKESSIFVPYEIALELKNKGYNHVWRYNYYLLSPLLEMTPTQTELNHEIIFGDKYYESYSERHPDDILVPSPMYQQVVDWFREKYNIHIEISTSGLPGKYKVFIPGTEHGFIYRNNEIEIFDYYDALDNGIIEALKLI